MADNIWARNGGVYFGYGSQSTQGAPPLLETEIAYVGDRHLLTIGPSGSGKTRRLLVPNLERLRDWSIVIIDPKGDLAAMTADYRRRFGDVFIINPFDVLGLGSNGFNPVAALDAGSDDFPDDAFDLAEALIRIEGMEPHFAQSAQDLVAALIMYARVQGTNGGSLGLVRRWLGYDPRKFSALAAKIALAAEAKEPKIEEMGTKIRRFTSISDDDREIKGVISTALAQTRWLDSRPIKADLEKPAFDAAMMKDRPTTVYLTLPARRLVSHSAWLRLIISSLIQPLVKDTRRSRVPILFMLDEFAQLGHLPILENNYAMFRGYSVKMWAILQDLSQGRAIYKERFDSFIANSGVLQSFAPQDLATAEYLSKRTGVAGKAILSKSLNLPGASKKGASGAESMNVGPQALPVMLPQDIYNMDAGFQVIFSHKFSGTLQAFAPYPTALPQLRDICARDPSV